MQKKLIALAVAGLMAAPVFAQSNVTVYGRVDYGYMTRSGDNGGVADRDRLGEFASGIQAGSRLGFKGAEDLGNGLKALFQMEFGTGVDANTGLGVTRNAYVGLTGNFGTVVGGRLDGVRYGVFNKYDAFGGGNVGNFTQMTAQVDRANNAVAYISPSFGGLTATLAYATHIGNSNPLGLAAQEGGAFSRGTDLNADGDVLDAGEGGATAAAAGDGNDGDAQLNTIMLAYDNGPISATVDWERVKFNSGAVVGTAAAVDKVTVTTVAGSYDFGVVKLSALYDILKVDDRNNSGVESDVRSWFVSAKAPVGSNVVLKATYGRTEDKETGGVIDASKWGIGADYLFSKRTNLYASFGSIRNKDLSALELSPAANSQGGGYGVRGLDIGIAHKF